MLAAPLRQRHAVDELEHEVQDVLDLPEIEDHVDVGVVQGTCDLGLAQEALLGRLPLALVGPQDLDRHASVHERIESFVDL